MHVCMYFTYVWTWVVPANADGLIISLCLRNRRLVCTVHVPSAGGYSQCDATARSIVGLVDGCRRAVRCGRRTVRREPKDGTEGGNADRDRPPGSDDEMAPCYANPALSFNSVPTVREHFVWRFGAKMQDYLTVHVPSAGS